jgi:hypothetical protein
LRARLHKANNNQMQVGGSDSHRAPARAHSDNHAASQAPVTPSGSPWFCAAMRLLKIIVCQYVMATYKLTHMHITIPIAAASSSLGNVRISPKLTMSRALISRIEKLNNKNIVDIIPIKIFIFLDVLRIAAYSIRISLVLCNNAPI